MANPYYQEEEVQCIDKKEVRFSMVCLPIFCNAHLVHKICPHHTFYPAYFT